ncbi:hypothetical protein CHCC14427_4430 [Bacillus paralicheniformis]|nr:hypothetical protein CHCC14427_4430 [Bacillus paralicheniformis]
MKERSLQKKRSFCLFLNKAESRHKHNDQLLLSTLSLFIQHH